MGNPVCSAALDVDFGAIGCEVQNRRPGLERKLSDLSFSKIENDDRTIKGPVCEDLSGGIEKRRISYGMIRDHESTLTTRKP